MSDPLFNKDRFREAMGDMSVVDLAVRLGCPKSSISMYLSGQRSPSKMAIQLIALNLGVNPAWLCGLAGERAEAEVGATAMTASDTVTQIPQAVRRLEMIRDRMM